MFSGCENLQIVYAPKAQKIEDGEWIEGDNEGGQGAFSNTAITNLDFKNLEIVGSYAFSNCKEAFVVELPLCK